MKLIKFRFLLINFFIVVSIIYIITQIVSNELDVYTRHSRYIIVPDLSSVNSEEAILQLKKLKLYPILNTSYYNNNFMPYQVLYLIPKPGTYVKPGRTIIVQANGKYFNPTILPNIINNHKRIAMIKLSFKNVLIKDIIYVPDITQNVILKVLYNNKSIEPGTILPYNSEIDLVLGQGYKNNIIIPSVIGLNLSSAKKILEEKNFFLGRIFYKKFKYNTDMKVYYQKPLAGKLSDEGKYINLWLTNGNQNNIDSLIKNYHLKE